MKVGASFSKEISDELAALQASIAKAIASIPAIPYTSDLVTTNFDPSGIFSGNVDLPIAASADLAAYLKTLTAKFNAFAGAK